MIITDETKKAETKRFSFFILSVSSVASAFIGLASTIILAANFGTGPEMDAFLIALVVPKSLSSILMTCLAMLAVPMFVKVKEDHGERSAWRLATRIFLLAGVALSTASILLALLSDQAAQLIAPGLSYDDQLMTAMFIAILAPVLTVGALETLMKSFFQAMGRFSVTVYASVLGSLSYLALLYFLIPIYGILGAVVAVTSQYTLILLFQLTIGLWGKSNLVDLRSDDEQRKLLQTLVSSAAVLTFTTSVRRLNPLLEKYFASQATTGSVSYISYGARIVTIINNFYLRNVSQVLFPSIASHFAQFKPRRAMEEVILGSRLNMFIVFPLIAGIGVIREPLIRSIYERGAFTSEDTTNVSLALFYGSLFLLQPMVQSMTSKALYSVHAIKFISFDAYLKLAIYVALMYILMPRYGFIGIILAGSLTITWPLHFIYLYFRIGPYDFRSFLTSLLRILALSSLMWVCCTYWAKLVTFQSQTLTDLIQLITTPVLGISVYAGGAWLMNYPEMTLAVEKLLTRKKKKMFSKKPS
ncbi:MAG: lipid II flippase MurJ [Halioglobus sp.]|nr:lipid II flippase MurJ [Halioglobus sp.]